MPEVSGNCEGDVSHSHGLVCGLEDQQRGGGPMGRHRVQEQVLGEGFQSLLSAHRRWESAPFQFPIDSAHCSKLIGTEEITIQRAVKALEGRLCSGPSW